MGLLDLRLGFEWFLGWGGVGVGVRGEGWLDVDEMDVVMNDIPICCLSRCATL
jgi:hypothetical protein